MAPRTIYDKKWVKVTGAIIAAASVIFGAIAGDLHLTAQEVPSQSAIEARLLKLEMNGISEREAISRIDANTTYLRDRIDRLIDRLDH